MDERRRASFPGRRTGTWYAPATPYADAVALTRELGNARLLTMDGDGHTAAFNGVSPCVDLTVTAYLVSLRLPPEGTVCPQQVEPFGPAAGLMARARRILDGVGPIPTAVATAGPRRR